MKKKFGGTVTEVEKQEQVSLANVYDDKDEY
jgi:hypothetical protein